MRHLESSVKSPRQKGAACTQLAPRIGLGAVNPAVQSRRELLDLALHRIRRATNTRNPVGPPP